MWKLNTVRSKQGVPQPTQHDTFVHVYTTYDKTDIYQKQTTVFFIDKQKWTRRGDKKLPASTSTDGRQRGRRELRRMEFGGGRNEFYDIRHIRRRYGDISKIDRRIDEKNFIDGRIES